MSEVYQCQVCGEMKAEIDALMVDAKNRDLPPDHISAVRTLLDIAKADNAALRKVLEVCREAIDRLHELHGVGFVYKLDKAKELIEQTLSKGETE